MPRESSFRTALVLCCAARTAAWVLYSPIPTSAPGSEDFRQKEYYKDGKLWQNTSSFNLDQAVLRWGLPPDPYTVGARRDAHRPCPTQPRAQVR